MLHLKDKMVRADTITNPSTCYLQETHVKHKDTERYAVKAWEKIYDGKHQSKERRCGDMGTELDTALLVIKRAFHNDTGSGHQEDNSPTSLK